MKSLEQGISWRVYINLEGHRAKAVTEAHFTPQDDRTLTQQRTLFDAQWQTRKSDNRQHNVGLATGRVHTSNGVTVFRDGNGQPRKK